MQFWKDGYRYDMIRHGFKFEKKTTIEQAEEKIENLNELYGDLK